MDVYKLGQWFTRTTAERVELYVLSLTGNNDRGGSQWNLICVNDGYRWDDALSLNGSKDDGVPKEVLEDWMNTTIDDERSEWQTIKKHFAKRPDKDDLV